MDPDSWVDGTASKAIAAYYYNTVPDGIIFWSFFFPVPLEKSSFTSFIFQTRLADSRLLAACLLSEPVQQSYNFRFTGAVASVLATTYFRIAIASRDEAISVFDFNKLEPDPRTRPVDVDTTKTKRSISLRNANLDEKKTILQLFAIAPPLNRVAALDSRRNRPPSIRPTIRL